MAYHYAFDAANLVEDCLEQVQEVIESDERSKRPISSLYDMKEALAEAELQLYDYFQFVLQKEVENSSSHAIQELYDGSHLADLSSSADLLQCVMRESLSITQEVDATHSYYPTRSATDSLLFRLNVALQLCLVRIDDARLVITGRRRKDTGSPKASSSSSSAIISIVDSYYLPIATAVLGWAAFSLVCTRKNAVANTGTVNLCHPFLASSAKAGFAVVAFRWINRKLGNFWMSTKIVRSTEEIEQWNRTWNLVQRTPPPSLKTEETPPSSRPPDTTEQQCHDISLEAARSQRLIEYSLHETHKTSFWHSQGELRFLMLKRAMDVFYASVGTAMDYTQHGDSGDETNWQLTLATAAAASFYSLTGARDRAAAVTSSSETASNLIRNAWGMVSLPAVKNLSLQASRLLKGAAVADRIEICGVPCFVLSSEPAPELAAAIKRSHRMHQRRKPITTLCTIDEQEEHTPVTRRNSKPFARSLNTRYRQRDVIFHLTGGGFFAHIIASDLPYLLDWSASTEAVVICPEYALLPEHRFPRALYQIENVYKALVSDEAVTLLGFETNRIVVTGESAGGNLAASLCIKVCMDRAGIPTSLSDEENEATVSSMDRGDEVEISLDKVEEPATARMPDALMLSCPVLNLSLEMSHSRVVGTEDPVLPSGLISAISDAYLPSELGISKKDPLASPFYASDDVLRQFPPTLLFASSNDPLLDDSVVFNQRLRSHSVDSNLFAAQNLPHAYLGLGTAGFPEAQQVQEQCVNWLGFQLTRDGDE